MRGLGKSLRALRVLLACLLLGTIPSAIAARPAAPIVMVDSRAEPAGRRGPEAARAAAPAAGARTPAAPRRAWNGDGAGAEQVRERLRTHGLRAAQARRTPARPSYLLRHALLR